MLCHSRHQTALTEMKTLTRQAQEKTNWKQLYLNESSKNFLYNKTLNKMIFYLANTHRILLQSMPLID